MGFLGALFGFATKPLEIVLETRRAKKAAEAGLLDQLVKAQAARDIAKIEADSMRIKARAELKMKQAEHAANWEITMAQASMKSWKDEYLTVIFSIPFLITFAGVAIAVFPGTEGVLARMYQATEMAWAQLASAPEWYTWLLFAAASASFGIRLTDMFFKKGK